MRECGCWDVGFGVWNVWSWVMGLICAYVLACDMCVWFGVWRRVAWDMVFGVCGSECVRCDVWSLSVRCVRLSVHGVGFGVWTVCDLGCRIWSLVCGSWYVKYNRMRCVVGVVVMRCMRIRGLCCFVWVFGVWMWRFDVGVW